MRVRIKICGLRTVEAIEAAAEAGADAVGLVFADSPRRVDPAAAARLAAAVPAPVARVAVFRRPAPKLVAEVLSALRPDWVQADMADQALFSALPPRCLLPVCRNEEELAATTEGQSLLFEGPCSGVGRPADWEQAARWARRRRLFLAGGLDPENVARAIAVVRPWGVDVSSGVERERGEKDPARIRAFVRAVRQAERTVGEE
ncbi:MAG: phosphoribosylanthranilate isomerase [Acidobacteriota bacterium]|nr:phosphoribosylanthranilate isomerase [Acidobacteriota bacterium]MDQ7087966.1 phosphoribosylanthranilate isomerase [Acidobacteriota bacterium]